MLWAWPSWLSRAESMQGRITWSPRSCSPLWEHQPLSCCRDFAGSGVISRSRSQASSHVVILMLFYVVVIDLLPDDVLDSPSVLMPSWRACHFHPGTSFSSREKGTRVFTRPRDLLVSPVISLNKCPAELARLWQDLPACCALSRSSCLYFPLLLFPFHLNGDSTPIIPFRSFHKGWQ